MKISARNQLEGTVQSIRRGEAIANVELDVAGQAERPRLLRWRG
jgi:molybdopterin-binding protein